MFENTVLVTISTQIQCNIVFRHLLWMAEYFIVVYGLKSMNNNRIQSGSYRNVVKLAGICILFFLFFSKKKKKTKEFLILAVFNKVLFM